MLRFILSFVKRYLLVILFLPILGWPVFYKFKCSPKIEKQDTVIVIQNDSLCDLQKNFCEWELSPYGKLKIEIFPRPIFANRKYKAVMQLENSNWIPLAMDFSGSEMEMGFNRPEFKKSGDNKYTADFVLEACATDEIKWKTLLIFQSKEGEKYGVPFYFTVRKK